MQLTIDIPKRNNKGKMISMLLLGNRDVRVAMIAITKDKMKIKIMYKKPHDSLTEEKYS